MEASEVIKKLGLIPLPEEGGYFRETFKDAHSTCIYYFITPEEFSSLHAVKSNENFHFYAGDPVEMIQIHPESGELKKITLGPNIEKDETPQVLVEALTWQGAKLASGGKWALMGCTVAPAFEFSDFVKGERSELLKKFPQHQNLIELYL